ncbi:MAG: S41 family peptidase [Candidatus Babeliales bacterium]
MNKNLLSVIGIASIFFLLFLPQQPTADQTQSPINFDKGIYEWSKTMAEAFHLVHTKHYQLTDPSKPMVNAIVAFTKSLDPHSAFLDKKSYEDIIQSTKGELCGIGIIVDNTMETDDEFLRIIDTIPTGPADKVNIKAEDKIIEIDNQPVRGMTLEEAIGKLKGKCNTTVNVKIQRSDTTRHLDFTITRDIVKEPNALCYYLKDHNAYYLCLNMFTENSIRQVEELLKKIQNQQSKGLILDLRNNSGGLLNAVVDIAGLFLDKDSLVVTTKGRDDKEIDRYATSKEPVLTNRSTPIFILVNNYTASAAEILAGCLQIHADSNKGNCHPFVFIVGDITFGKGSVQEIIPVSNDCAMKLSIALYYLPNGQSIQGIGIIPDFAIAAKMPPSQEAMWFNNTFGRESALKNAIKLDQENANPMAKNQQKVKKDPEKSWYEKKQDIISTDYLILSTLRLLEMLDMAKKAFPEKVKTRKEAITLLERLYTPKDRVYIEEITI